MPNLGSVGSVFVEVGADLARLNTELGRAVPQAASAGQTAGQSFSSGFSSGLSSVGAAFDQFNSELTGIGARLTASITVPLVALGVAAVSAFAEIDSLKRGLVATTGSAEEAARQFAELREVAKLPGLGLEEAARGAVNLQNFGFSANEAKTILLNFGNALATVGKGRAELDRVILQLGQMAGASKVLIADLRPIIQQVPQVAEIIRTKFGPEVLSAPAEALAALGVSSREFIRILVEELGKLPKVTGGIKNELENFVDSTKIALATFGEDLAPAVGFALNVIAQSVTAAVTAFGMLPDSVKITGVALAGLAAVAGPAIIVIAQLSKGIRELQIVFTGLRGVTAAQQLTFGFSEAATGASGLSAALGVLGTALAAANFLAAAGSLGQLIVKINEAPPSLEQMQAALKKVGVELDRGSLSAEQFAEHVENAFRRMNQAAQGGGLEAKRQADSIAYLEQQAGKLGIALKRGGMTFAEYTDALRRAIADAKQTGIVFSQTTNEIITKQQSLRDEFQKAKRAVEELLVAQRAGKDVSLALALAQKDLKAAHDALNPSLKETERLTKEAAEREKERINLVVGARIAMAEYGAAMVQWSLDAQGAAITGDGLNTVWIDGVGYIRSYTEEQRKAAAEGINSISQLREIVTGMSLSLRDARDKMTGLTVSIKELRGAGSADLVSLADALAELAGTADDAGSAMQRLTGKVKDGWISMKDYLGTAEQVPEWVMKGTVAIIDGVRVLSDDAVKKHEAAEAAEKLASSNRSGAESYKRLADEATEAAGKIEASSGRIMRAAEMTASGFPKLTGSTIGLPGFGNSGREPAGAGLGTDALQMMIAAMTMGFQDAGLISSQSIETMRRLGWTFMGGRSFERTETVNIAQAIGEAQLLLNSINQQLPRNMRADDIAGKGGLALTSDSLARLDAAIRQASQNLERFRQGVDAAGRSFKSAADLASDLSKQTADKLVPTYHDLEDQLWRLIDAGQGNSSAAWDLRNKMAAMGNAFTDAAPAVDQLTNSAVRAGTAIIQTGLVVETVAQKVSAAAGTLARIAGVDMPSIEPSPTGPAIPATGSTARFAAYGDSLQYSGGGFTVNVYGGVFGPDSPRYFAEQVTDILRQDARLG